MDLEQSKITNHRRKRAMKRWQRMYELQNKSYSLKEIAKKVRQENGRPYTVGGVKKGIRLFREHYNLTQ